MIRLSEICKNDWQLIRDGEFESLGLCNARAGIPLLTFCGNQKFFETALRNKDISCVMIPLEMAETLTDHQKGVIAVPDLRIDFFSLHNELCGGSLAERYRGTFTPTEIGKNCVISEQAAIDPEGVSIGMGTVIEPFVRIHTGTTIGENCIIRSGSVLGGTGLEFIRYEGGILPVHHQGKLLIGDNVEIQYNCNVSRSLFPWHKTIIGDESKIESLVHIAHGVHIGKRALIAASACIAGSAILGDDVWVGPNATVSSEVRIGDRARVNLGAVAAGNVGKGETVTGNFALPHALFMQEYMDTLRKEY